ncbi:hypothetical protein CRENBAI_004586 [Crenichthys baileyi]|uniref:Uncharacterized protein n=1 Tax=Crenichthys baileyi TaxID=28760 RepID=A0AAV9SDT4_9TELE
MAKSFANLLAHTLACQRHSPVISSWSHRGEHGGWSIPLSDESTVAQKSTCSAELLSALRGSSEATKCLPASMRRAVIHAVTLLRCAGAKGPSAKRRCRNASSSSSSSSSSEVTLEDKLHEVITSRCGKRRSVLM